MSHPILFLAALSGFIAVAAGAFGAHGLKARLAPDLLAIFETGARYHVYHALAMALAALIAMHADTAAAPALASRARLAGWLFFVGTFFFSGSLYLLALTGTRWLGAITPIGGLAFLAGWLALAFAALTHRT